VTATVAPGQEPTDWTRKNLPLWAWGVVAAESFTSEYELSTILNPYFRRGDWDGDGRPDLAILIRQRSSGKTGIALVQRANQIPQVVGAGTPFGNGGDDFKWMLVWRVEPAARVRPDWTFGSDVICLEKGEIGGCIYWDGTAYQWYQAGD
jgi:hypothetical protein